MTWRVYRLDDSTPSNRTPIQRGLDKRNLLIKKRKEERSPDIGSPMLGKFSSTIIHLDYSSWSQVVTISNINSSYRNI